LKRKKIEKKDLSKKVVGSPWIHPYIHEVSCDKIREDIQEKLNLLLDECWLMITEENAVLFHETCQKLREIFNDIFSIPQIHQSDTGFDRIL
jgi:hypothetical protein